MEYSGKIFYTIDEGHPDIKYVKDWTEDVVYDFDDEYTFSEEWEEEIAIESIKNDLRLVAGGGYNTDHIHNVRFEINRM